MAFGLFPLLIATLLLGTAINAALAPTLSSVDPNPRQGTQEEISVNSNHSANVLKCIQHCKVDLPWNADHLNGRQEVCVSHCEFQLGSLKSFNVWAYCAEMEVPKICNGRCNIKSHLCTHCTNIYRDQCKLHFQPNLFGPYSYCKQRAREIDCAKPCKEHPGRENLNPKTPCGKCQIWRYNLCDGCEEGTLGVNCRLPVPISTG